MDSLANSGSRPLASDYQNGQNGPHHTGRAAATNLAQPVPAQQLKAPNFPAPLRPFEPLTAPHAQLHTTNPSRSLLDRLERGERQAALIFAGQGIPYLDELRQLEQQNRIARPVIHEAAALIASTVSGSEFRRSGYYPKGFDLLRWLHSPEQAPDLMTLSSSVISQSLVFLLQCVRYMALYEEGLSRAFAAGAIRVATGHSQGVMPALLVSEAPNGKLETARVLELVRYYLYQGLHMQDSFGGLVRGRAFDPSSQQGDQQGDATPMAAISKLDLPTLEAAVKALNRQLPPSDQLYITLLNTRTRHVVSGPARALRRLRSALDAQADLEKKAKAKGKFGGTPAQAEWEYLPVSAAFHSPYMASGLERMRETAKALHFKLDASRLSIPVLSPSTGLPLNTEKDLTETLLQFQFLEAVHWEKTLRALAETPHLTDVLDLGPGDAVARLTSVCLRGSGIRVLPVALPKGQKTLFGEDNAAPELDYRQFMPRVVRLPDASLRLDNTFTRFTGRPPVLLPGMTPTTVDAPIVAAAANGGFVAELAGGGQVTEALFRTRIDELRTLLTPGREVVFNALFLDPYLWGLHFSQKGLVVKLKQEGAPLCGVTVSAGIPEVPEATKLLDELFAAGLWLNAFKPGTLQQIDAVLRIAEANPSRTLLIQIEGGKAGGHHSWEELDQLLLERYHRIRQQSNLILCVGGGVGTPERATELLTGTWSARYGQRPMPVDAVFPGTVTMACKEALTSPQVKAALVQAAGTARWVFSGASDGGVTSGKSNLNADIHYLDNAASRVGKLLDEVAGDAQAIQARKLELIDALNRTAKPYFGELSSMTYLEVLTRMIALMAIGRGGRYEDGIWLDVSYRERVADFLRCAEARISPPDQGEIPSILNDLSALDRPKEVIQSFINHYGDAVHLPLHPLDVNTFIHQICRRPGKPVNFVPVIDEQVRTWYKSDSLWQAHDDRYSADEVLVIPGPEAVRGIQAADEPVATVLDRFQQAVLDQLLAQTPASQVPALEMLTLPRPELPEGIQCQRLAAQTFELRIPEPQRKGTVSPTQWFEVLGSPLPGAPLAGPLARAFLAAEVLETDAEGQGRRRPNPLRQLFAPVPGAVVTMHFEPEIGVTSVLYRRTETTGSPLERPEDVQLSWGGEVGELQVVLRPRILRGATRGESTPLRFSLFWQEDGCVDLYSLHAASFAQALRRFYHRALFGGEPGASHVSLFAPVSGVTRMSAADARAYAAITGTPVTSAQTLPLNAAFTLAWEPLFQVISHETLAGGLLQLVHLSNHFEPFAGWPLHADEEIPVEARLLRIEDRANGRTLITGVTLSRGDRPCLRLESAFFIRSAFAHTPLALQALEPFSKTLTLDDAASIQFLLDHPWVTLNPGVNLQPGDAITLNGMLGEVRPRVGRSHFDAQLELARDNQPIGTLRLELESEALAHPVKVLCDVLQPPRAENQAVASKRLATELTETPRELLTFAEVGRDGNPLHLSPLMARMAGLDQPIVHGMWTSARALAFLTERVARGNAARVAHFETTFLAPALLGETLRLTATRVGVLRGQLEVEVLVEALRGTSPVQIMRGKAHIAPPRTAYIFPGQGIQRPQMGMEGYARSVAARAVWDRADAFTRETLGFSLLRVVRENPKELIVHGQALVHEQGVLHLTQLTQVAMAVLAQAQVAELREAGVLIDDALTCGHSVGEYNTFGALAGVLPLETVIQMVYQRGCTMHRLIPRDADGESGFRMGVIRPNIAGLDEEGAVKLVEAIALETGLPLQIVNYNIRGRQYSVTGRREALQVLERRLAALTPAGSKGAYLEVPGIDTPFHSHLLHNGVADFRAALEARFPAHIPYERLVGRYIPNLVPKPFTLEHHFIEEVATYTGSPVLAAVLEDFAGWMQTPERLARTLIIELLSWQFASPVRWVETQELLFRPLEMGGLGVERVIEVGVGYQPTLANMAKASLQGIRNAPAVEVLNIEADRDAVFYLDADVQVEPETVRPSASGSASESAVSSTTGAATTSTPRPAAPSAPLTAAAPVQDVPVTVEESLRVLLALQARVRPEQLLPTETIDQLFEGVSSRRNQVLIDLGQEFNLGTLDGAHEKPIAALAAELTARAKGWTAPGKYTRAAQDEALTRVLGATGMSRKDALLWLERTWGLGAGLSVGVLNAFTLATRAGASVRGGALGDLAASTPSSKHEAEALLDQAVTLFSAAKGLTLVRAGAGGGGESSVVDAAAVQALSEQVLGADGVLMRTARRLASELGHPLEPADLSQDSAQTNAGAATSLAAQVKAELGADFLELVAPRFKARRHVAFTSARAFAKRDVAKLFFEARAGRIDREGLQAEVQRLSAFSDARCSETARHLATRARAEGLLDLADGLDQIARGGGDAPLLPEVLGPAALQTFVEYLFLNRRMDAAPTGLRFGATGGSRQQANATATTSSIQASMQATLLEGTSKTFDFRGKTALVTGAGPSSIALETVKHLLRGGARVILTTSNASRERLRFYRQVYQRCAAPDAELHVVPFNQASMQDVEALVNWLFDPVTEQVGAATKVIKRPFVPDLVLPFAAIGEIATLDQLSGKSEVTLRTLLLAVERMIGAIALRFRRDGAPAQPCHVVLPLSPNHGGFGGDGAYAESKAALEVLLNKWHSEQAAWGRYVTLCAARIGWVRSTGLMSGNDTLAGPLEARTGLRTFSTFEMGYLIAGLCTSSARDLSLKSPLDADLTGGFCTLEDLKGTVDGIKRELEAEATLRRRVAALRTLESTRLGLRPASPVTVKALPWWPSRPRPVKRAGKTQQVGQLVLSAPSIDLSKTVVIVGLGEVSPWGSARTRYEIEVDDRLSPAGVLELAWMTGLVRFEQNDRGGSWVDGETGEAVAEESIADRYEQAVKARSGIRFMEPELTGFDPESLTVLAPVHVEEELTFRVGTEAEARAFLQRDPAHTRVHADAARGDWTVTRLKGAKVNVPRQSRLSRAVAGQVPTGLDFTRYGIPRDLVDNVDRLTLFNLVATVDSFLSSGLTPEELLSWVHPAKVANTQGAGIGGMRSLQRLYTDHLVGKPRQGDILQETLINVIAGYIVQSYIGSYGPMSHPVGACATAAVSVEDGYDKILVGKADFVIAGGFDDIGIEGAIGFSDMNATADTDEMRELGLEPGEMSRPNDLRRRGFVEGQGGGTLLLARADLALRMGLPVVGVVGYAGSFGDGIQKSVPAPGLGILACAAGGKHSPLGEALHHYGLTADDIGLVYKHDTSTGANDPNENNLHHQIQVALGRTPGNPLFVVSQKSLTGHAKGGAAAWQINGLCQSLEAGTIPGNRNLDCLDPAMEKYSHLAFTDAPIKAGKGQLKAGLATSLGFGHVGAIVLVLSREVFESLVPTETRDTWQAAVDARLEAARRARADVLLGRKPAYEKRSHRRFEAADGTEAQQLEEIHLLTHADARLDGHSFRYSASPSTPHSFEKR